MKRKAILLFDWDDTLVKSTSKFVELKENVAKKIIEYSDERNINKLVEYFDQREIQNMRERNCRGYGNFKITLMQVASEILKYDFFEKGMYEYINEAINILSEESIEFIDGAFETVQKLFDKGYQMYIVTKANKEEQELKILSANIIKYFKEVIFVKEKSEQGYIEVLKKINANTEECIMIGNSPKSDINPSKRIGIQTILIPNDKTWKFEKEPIISGEPETIILKKISDLLREDWHVMQ